MNPTLKLKMEELAEEAATKIAGGPLRDQAWSYVRRDFLAGATAMHAELTKPSESDEEAVKELKREIFRLTNSKRRGDQSLAYTIAWSLKTLQAQIEEKEKRIAELEGMFQDRDIQSSMEAQSYADKAVQAETERCASLATAGLPAKRLHSEILNPSTEEGE